jgi:hypothetical protein
MSLDDCCDGSCSSLYAIGCEIISHEEVERQLDAVLKYNFREKCTLFIDNLMKDIKGLYNYLK